MPEDFQRDPAPRDPSPALAIAAAALIGGATGAVVTFIAIRVIASWGIAW